MFTKIKILVKINSCFNQVSGESGVDKDVVGVSEDPTDRGDADVKTLLVVEVDVSSVAASDVDGRVKLRPVYGEATLLVPNHKLMLVKDQLPVDSNVDRVGPKFYSQAEYLTASGAGYVLCCGGEVDVQGDRLTDKVCVCCTSYLDKLPDVNTARHPHELPLARAAYVILAERAFLSDRPAGVE